MTKEPADFAVNEQILRWEPADHREAANVIRLDAGETAAARQFAANTGQPVYVLDVAAEPVESEPEPEPEL